MNLPPESKRLSLDVCFYFETVRGNLRVRALGGHLKVHLLGTIKTGSLMLMDHELISFSCVGILGIHPVGGHKGTETSSGSTMS